MSDAAPELVEAQARVDALCAVAHHWIGRFYSLQAAMGLIPPEAVMSELKREADAINARLFMQPAAETQA
jgi:hypothetical protein